MTRKVEEMKQKMKYYVAKTLIERYDHAEGSASGLDTNAAVRCFLPCPVVTVY
jgi:hypothetical protein